MSYSRNSTNKISQELLDLTEVNELIRSVGQSVGGGNAWEAGTGVPAPGGLP